ncbi:chromatin modification- protein VID21 [Apophysomyces ossiformis]|uniref:Vacuolar import and degradation protein 21 n=1 Tax=Apophysomyces ossiformis TaxID=679940 RepID=A0A8H7BR55_9FUNG|nr:chromatin modification- protein VID21 [Apophysomyces ossiformis]
MAADISNHPTTGQESPTAEKSHSSIPLVGSVSQVGKNHLTSLKINIEELRIQAEEDRKEKLRQAFSSHRETLLKELFVIMGQKEGGSDGVMDFLEDSDVTNLDNEKWNKFLDKHKLSISPETPSEEEPISEEMMVDGVSDAQRPEDKSGDLAKKSARRMPPPPARMVTRGVSGAIRHKSVEEILAGLDNKELDSLPTPQKEKVPSLSLTTETAVHQQVSAPRPSARRTPQRTITPLLRRSDSKNYPILTYNGHKFLDRRSDKFSTFDLYAWQLRANAQPLYKSLQTARKILTTHDWMLARDELKSIKTIQSIENLKKGNMWSLRQLKRQKSVPRTKTHWDSLLDEMKWMRTDYKEERKWKIACAFMLSRAVLEWHKAEDKSSLCVKALIPSPVEYKDSEKALESNTMSLEGPNQMPDIAMGASDNQGIVLNEAQDMPVSPTKEEESTPASSVIPELSPGNTGEVIQQVQQPSAGEGVEADHQQSSGPSVPEPPKRKETETPTTTTTTTTSMTAEEPEAMPTLSLETIEKIRTAVKTLSLDVPTLVLSDEEFADFNVDTVFPELLLYEPPKPDANDPYFDESEYGRIVPISKLSTRKLKFKKPQRLSRKRTADGQQIVIYEEEEDKKDIKVLPRHERYDTAPLLSPLFAPKRLKDIPAQQPPTPQPPSGERSTSAWSEEDDICLISLILQYSFNWELICDAFNTVRTPINGEKRTPWECHEHWKRNNLTSLSGQVNSAYVAKLKKDLSKRQSLFKFDSAKKRQRQYNIFEAIKKTQKKREESQRTSNTVAPPRSTIETYGMSSTGQRLPTAMEMSMHKAQRDRQMAQALLEQRQYSLAAQPSNGVARATHTGAMPLQHAQVPAQPRPATTSASAATPPTPTASSAAVAAAAAAAAAANRVMTASSGGVARPPQIPSNQVATGLPLNRYPAAQLHLLRQHQMFLAAGQAPGQARPPVSAPIQRFANVVPVSQPQAAHSPATNTEFMQQQQPQQVSQVASPALPQQGPAQSPHQATMHANTANPLLQLAQMGYAIPQLAPSQQAQLQRYLAQFQMRTAATTQAQAQAQIQAQAAAAAAAAAVAAGGTAATAGAGGVGGAGGQGSPQAPQILGSPGINQNTPSPQQLASAIAASNGGLSAALLAAQQQQQRFQVAQFQQALQLQQQLQQAQQVQHAQAQAQQEFLRAKEAEERQKKSDHP